MNWRAPYSAVPAAGPVDPLTPGEQMTEIISFQALAFDLVDGRLVEGQLVNCGSPALAIQTAQGQWKIFGHAGAVAFSRTSFFGRE